MGLVRLPSWVEDAPDGKPRRPWAAVWVNLRTGLVNVKVEPELGAHDWTLALDALIELGLKHNLAGVRPARLEVADAELGAQLVQALGDDGLALTVSRHLPAVKAVLAEMGADMRGAPLPPDALDAPGVTVELMGAFATAAKRFYEAAPGRRAVAQNGGFPEKIPETAPLIAPSGRQ